MTRYTYASRRWKINKTVKDYMIPVIWIFILLVVIISIFFWWNNDWETSTKLNTIQSWSNIIVKLDWATSEAYIMSDKDKKQLISGAANLWINQKLIVKEWSASIDYDDFWTFKLNKMWELVIDQKWWLKLVSSDLWINAKKSIIIDTLYSKVKISAGSVISLSQNEALSTIYIISGSAEISNLVWVKTLLWNLQKLTIWNQDASNKDINLSISKDNLDDFFKNSEWYVKNEGDAFINVATVINSWSISWINSSTWDIWNDILTLDDIRDDLTVSSDKLIISWKFSNDFVSSIVLDWKKAKLNLTNKTFTFDTILLTKRENDLVFKLYDTDENIISKVIYTVFYNWKLAQDLTEKTESPTSQSTSWFEVTNYQVDWSKFIFTQPWPSPYTTYETKTTIRWQTPAWIVTKVVVNGFTLSSFNWTTWRYHADVSSGNFKDWTNVYEINYYWSNWKLVYTNTYVIIKKAKVISPASISSGEDSEQ